MTFQPGDRIYFENLVLMPSVGRLYGTVISDNGQIGGLIVLYDTYSVGEKCTPRRDSIYSSDENLVDPTEDFFL